MNKTITAMLIIMLCFTSPLYANDADVRYSTTEEKIYNDQPLNYHWDDQTFDEVVVVEKRRFSRVTVEETEYQFVVTFHKVA